MSAMRMARSTGEPSSDQERSGVDGMSAGCPGERGLLPTPSRAREHASSDEHGDPPTLRGAGGFTLHAATRAGATDEPWRQALLK